MAEQPGAHGLEVTREPVAELRTYHRNPRVGDVTAIRRSLAVNGQYRPIVVNAGTYTDRKNEVLAGNHTLIAARDEGWSTVAVCWVDVDDDQAARIVLADNRTADLGEYDTAMLAELLGELASIEGTGYTEDDLAALLQPSEGDTGSEGGTQPEARRSLAERFGVPPLTLLDSRQGYWRDRKRQWINLGLASEVGRGADLLSGLESAARAQRRYDGAPEDSYSYPSVGTSVFDPVLCELLVRWYSAPGARVLDPFAGGSVRGIVAAACGRDYIGIDLRPEQVAANEEQAESILPAFGAPIAASGDYTPEVTAVEERGDYWVKRDDAWSRGGASGAKARAMFADAEAGGYPGIITAGARRSPQIERAALVAAALGIGCRVHVPEGADTPEIETCRAAGAEVLGHPHGRLSVLRARFREDAEAHPDWLAVPFGMARESYAESVAVQVANLPAEARRVVVPCGSGMTAAGILRGLQRAGRTDLPVLAVTLGHDPTEYLDAYTDGWRDQVTCIASDLDFDTDAPDTSLDGLSLDPMYEAKCLPHLQPGDVLWCVGLRRSAPPSTTPGAGTAEVPRPRWIVGNAREAADLVGEDEPGDLLLTCPPYFDLEQYSDEPGDLSRCADYDAFLTDYQACLAAASERMAQDAFAALITGAIRDKHGYILDLPADTTRIMERLGWRLYQDAILATSTGTAALRSTRPFASGRKMARVHQAVAVYHRGNLAMVRDWPPPEVGSLPSGEEHSENGMPAD